MPLTARRVLSNVSFLSFSESSGSMVCCIIKGIGICLCIGLFYYSLTVDGLDCRRDRIRNPRDPRNHGIDKIGTEKVCK